MKSKLLTIFLAAILTVTLSLGLASCKKNKLELSETEVSIAEGTSKIISVDNYDGKDTITWSSSNNSVATVVSMGMRCTIRGVSQGTATVTATAGKMTGECVVTVTEAEVITIFRDGVAVGDSISVEEGSTVNLTATASKGSSISWYTSDEKKAPVSNGTVSALSPGDVVITAMANANVKATVTIHITARAGSTYYDLLFGDGGNPVTEDGQTIDYKTFYYWASRTGWGQDVKIDHAYYRDGAVSIKYTSDWVGSEDPNIGGGYFYGFQLKYWNDDLTHQHYYKFTCKFTIDQHCFVSIADNIVELNEGENNVTVYYHYYYHYDADKAFTIMTGYDMGDGSNGYFVKDADFTISDMNWTDDTSTRVQLKTPSFTYAENTGVITITDSNTEGVGRYALNFYDDAGKCVSNVTVKSGEAVNTSRVPNGTYTAKLVAVAENSHYIDSAESESTATITVENESIEYELEATGIGGAVANPGTWSYHKSSWVEIHEKTYKDGVVTFDFSKNEGNWDDTQLYYRHPAAETGKIYRVKLTIDSNSTGHITISRSEKEILVGKHEYTIENVAHRAGDATVAIIFALYGQNNAQEIQAGRFVFSNVTIEETGVIEDQPINPDTTANPDDYNLGEKLDPSTNAMVNDEEAKAVDNTMTYWYAADAGWNCGTVVTMNTATYTDGTVHFNYTGGSVDYSVQLFYKNSQLQAGKKYFVFVTIKVDKDLQIKLNGTIMNLTAGTHTLAVMFDGADTDLSIQLYGVGSNTVDVTISDISWQEVLSKK